MEETKFIKGNDFKTSPIYLELGVYLTPEAHCIVKTPESRQRLNDLLTRVNNKFVDAFGLGLDYSMHKLPAVPTLPELIERGREVTNSKTVATDEEIKKFIDWYSNLPVCDRIVADHVKYFEDKDEKGYKIVLTNTKGFCGQGYSSGCAMPKEQTCVVNLYREGEDFQRYVGMLHELSHLFGAKDGGFPFNIMTTNPKRKDFWELITKRKMQKNIDITLSQ